MIELALLLQEGSTGDPTAVGVFGSSPASLLS